MALQQDKPSSSEQISTPVKKASASILPKRERAKLAKDLTNVRIPKLLQSHERALRGANSSQLIRYKPAPKPLSSAENISPADRAPKIRIIESDTFTAAQELASRHPKERVGVLNMCSPLRPGGGFLNGVVSSQEESLCTRSTLFPALYEHFYRLPEQAAVYSPDILVFKDQDGIEMAKSDMFFVDVISCSALRFPDVVVKAAVKTPAAVVENTEKSMKGKEKMVYETEADRELMAIKIKLILQIAKAKSIKFLVLGALGCGVYKNPVEEVAMLFRRIMCKKEYTDEVEEIVFAILKDEENLRTFKEVFEGIAMEE